ncbi:MAG: hypothetical protein F4Z69_08020 [Bacteroidetes bacterium SB0668_bin_1]|nr:hypothetical protein [Bacteroidetes bacterium SB0668_bin_1]
MTEDKAPDDYYPRQEDFYPGHWYPEALGKWERGEPITTEGMTPEAIQRLTKSHKAPLAGRCCLWL